MTLNDLLRDRLMKCDTIEEVSLHLENVLTEFLDAEIVAENTWELLAGRALVERVGRLNIHIFPHDHEPPHFHVVFGRDVSAKFRIDNGAYISGEIDSRDLRKIRCWYESLGAREKLSEVWSKLH